MKYLTVLAVVEVPDAVVDRSDDDILKVCVPSTVSMERTHNDVSRFEGNVVFATVAVGVTAAASAAGADESSWETLERPLTARQIRRQRGFREAAWCWFRTKGRGTWCAVTGNHKPILRSK